MHSTCRLCCRCRCSNRASIPIVPHLRRRRHRLGTTTTANNYDTLSLALLKSKMHYSPRSLPNPSKTKATKTRQRRVRASSCTGRRCRRTLCVPPRSPATCSPTPTGSSLIRSVFLRCGLDRYCALHLSPPVFFFSCSFCEIASGACQCDRRRIARRHRKLWLQTKITDIVSISRRSSITHTSIEQGTRTRGDWQRRRSVAAGLSATYGAACVR